MGDISPHFNRYEFRCKNGCGGDTIDVETLKVLEAMRQHFGVPVIINSGFRCAAHNKKVGGAKNSQHLYGRAADVTVQGVGPDSVAQYLQTTYPGKYGIGAYKTFTHIDTRSGPAVRWSG